MKPKRKKELAVSFFNEESGYIAFWANETIAQTFSQFGILKGDSGTGYYSLSVDRRYEFKDVLSFIWGHENPKE